MGESKNVDSQMCCKCQYDDKLEKYKVLYTAYADEIRNLWTRSVFLGAFMTLAWGGYGALQLKFITRKCDEFDMSAYICTSLGLCLVIVVLSLLWIAMAKGSKFVQRAHEEHIKKLNFDWIGLDWETGYIKRLFCDLENYQCLSLENSLLFCGTLNPCRYSPSKINIALGWVSFMAGFALFNIHILLMIDEIKAKFIGIVSAVKIVPYQAIFAFVVLYSLIFVVLTTILMKRTLISKNDDEG